MSLCSLETKEGKTDKGLQPGSSQEVIRPLQLLSLEPFISIALHKAFSPKDYAEFTISQFKTIKVICESSEVSTQTRQRPPVLMGLQEGYKGQSSVLSAS